MIMEILPRKVLIKQIKRIIETAGDGSHDDLIRGLSEFLIFVEKYAEEKGIKVVCSTTDIDELFIPYLRIYSHKSLLGLAAFGTEASLIDVSKLVELNHYMNEFMISTVPVHDFGNHLVFYCIPLIQCYSVLHLFDQSRNLLREVVK